MEQGEELPGLHAAAGNLGRGRSGARQARRTLRRPHRRGGAPAGSGQGLRTGGRIRPAAVGRDEARRSGTLSERLHCHRHPGAGRAPLASMVAHRLLCRVGDRRVAARGRIAHSRTRAAGSRPDNSLRTHARNADCLRRHRRAGRTRNAYPARARPHRPFRQRGEDEGRHRFQRLEPVLRVSGSVAGRHAGSQLSTTRNQRRHKPLHQEGAVG